MSMITKVRQNNQEEEFEFGASFDNVYCDFEDENTNTTKRFTLKTLYNYLKDFFNNGTFVMYSKKAPINPNVKIWYKIIENTEEQS